MPFLSLSPVNFRNLENSTIDLLAKEVYFTGENGQGKSNLLEALYCLSYGASFRTRTDSELIKNGEQSMSLRTIYREDNGNVHSTFVVLDKGHKKIEKDGKMLKDRKELINTMPCVLYNHDDLDFAVGTPERRRFFIDQSLSMYDVTYIDVIRRYKKILKNRNLCLKERKFELFDSYDIQLIMNGLEIQKKRQDAIFKFNQIFEKLYADISGIDGVNIRYLPSWKNQSESVLDQHSLPQIDDIMNLLKSKRDMERAMGTTLSGPHRDRIVFVKNNSAFIPKASTGQRRLVALILRTAQAVFYTQVTGRKPILLMDDVLLELDPEKRRKLTALLPEYDQLFCTFLPGEPYENYMHETTKVYKIHNGSWDLIK